MTRDRQWILKHVSTLVLGAAAILGSWNASKAEERPATTSPGGPRKFVFDRNQALAGWSLTGDVSIDPAKGRQPQGGSLKVGPRGKALLKLRDRDESGRVEIWVYDDGTRPADPKTSRAGPRWGLVQGDGKVFAVGVLYASYLGGSEGYTATACDGKKWFDQLFWLGVNRGPAGWHKWAFDFDAEEGLRLFHNDKEATAVDPSKAGLNGFNAMAIWGDEGKGDEQPLWVADVSVSLGGPVKPLTTAEADPYQGPAATLLASHPVVIYTRETAPPAPTWFLRGTRGSTLPQVWAEMRGGATLGGLTSI